MLPRGALGLHALRTAQATEAARIETRATAEAMRAQAGAAFAAASSRRRTEPDAASVLAASGDVLMRAADALERIGKAQAMTTGLLVMIAAGDG